MLDDKFIEKVAELARTVVCPPDEKWFDLKLSREEEEDMSDQQAVSNVFRDLTADVPTLMNWIDRVYSSIDQWDEAELRKACKGMHDEIIRLRAANEELRSQDA